MSINLKNHGYLLNLVLLVYIRSPKFMLTYILQLPSTCAYGRKVHITLPCMPRVNTTQAYLLPLHPLNYGEQRGESHKFSSNSSILGTRIGCISHVIMLIKSPPLTTTLNLYVSRISLEF